MLPIIHSQAPLIREELKPWAIFSKDVFNEVVNEGPSFVLGFDPRFLHFGARCSFANNSTKALLGEFKEGLWEGDVAEIFIKDPNSSRYQEINLGFQGAWWSTVFESYRKRASHVVEKAGVVCVKYPYGGGSEVILSIPRSSISFDLELAKLNVCMILGNSPRRYFSWFHFPLEKPDFHRLEYV